MFDIVRAEILDLVFVTRILEMFYLCNRLCIFSHSNERYFWKIIYYFQHNLFTKAQHKTFKASTAKQNMKIFFMYNPTFSRRGQRYPSKVFCLLMYEKILIPQKTKFSVRCINFAANCLFHIAINAF